MANTRMKRVNSLLKEVISDVIKKEVSDPRLTSLITIISVNTSKDLRNATVYVSVYGDEEARKKNLEALNSASNYIAIKSSQLIVLKYFPSLIFKLDMGLERHDKIESLLKDIHEKENLK